MFVVLGASGNTGRVVAETLLAQKHAVRVVVHDDHPVFRRMDVELNCMDLLSYGQLEAR